MEKQSTRKFLKLMIALVALFLLGSSALMLASCKEELHKHTWDEGKVTTEATCVSTGSRTYTCSDCGDIRIETIPATGVHTWGDPVEYAASCESDAYTIETCTVCGQEKTTILPNTKRDHNYAEHLVAASCTAAGSRTLSCTYCNDTYIDSHYAQEHPALGHSFAANEKEDDTLYGVAAKNVSAAGNTVTVEITLNEETYKGTGNSEATALAAAVEAAKKDGWTTQTAPNCTTAGEFVRSCTREDCEHVEEAEAKATGHKIEGQKIGQTLAEALAAKDPKQYVCTVDTSLVDAENKAIYAFECVNENCPVNVKVNAAGTTKHYIEAEAHKYGEAVPSENKDGHHPAATCEGKGYTQTTCEVCGKIEYTEVEKLGHNWNTMQLDGTTATGKCEIDTILSGDEGLKKMAEFVKKQLNDELAYIAAYKKIEAAYNAFDFDSKDASRFCLRCYAIDEATDHEYVIGTLQDGKYAPTDYIVDENGDPVVAEGVTKDTMTCRNVEVCKNCGETASTGAHDFDPDDATCRSGAICSVCNRPQTAQKDHEYVNVSDIITKKDQTTTISGLGWETTLTWKNAYAAYQKVSASLEWMAPVPGTCTTAGYNVAVCVHCLMDASEGVEFDWKRDEIAEGESFAKTGDIYSAFTQAVSASHEYEAAYFDTNVETPVKAESLSEYVLNCNVGYKVALFCKNCDLLYTNVPEVYDSENKKDPNEVQEGYTNAAGFLVEKEYWDDYTGTAWDQDAVNEVVNHVDKHVGDHELYIPNDYRDVKYTPATCASYAKIYYRCANCSYGVEIQLGADGAATAPDGCTITTEGTKVTNELTNVEHANKLNADGADKKYDPKNHAGTEFACGDHCKVTNTDGKTYICSGFVSQEPGTILGTKPVKDETDAKHGSVTITYLWSTDASVEYYKSYDIRFANVTNDDLKSVTEGEQTTNGVIDWTNVEISEKPETYIKACAGTTFTLPMGEKESGNTEGVYLVLVKGDDVYPVKAPADGDPYFNFYTEDSATGTKVTASMKPTQDDQFFVRFTATGTTVTDAPVVAVNTASFKLALNGAAVPGTDGKKTLTITIGKSFEVESTFTWGITEADNYVVDLGGYTLTSNVGELLTIGDNLTVKNGKFVFNANGSGLKIGATDGINVTFDNVDLVFEKGNGLEIAVDKNSANVVFNNSSVTVNEGTKGIYTTGTDENTENAITLKDTDVTVVPSTGTKDTAAMVIDVPVTVNVTGGTFTGTYQAIVVRAGTVTVDGATLDVKNDKSTADAEVTKDGFSAIANDGTYGWKVGDADEDQDWNDFAGGFTLQDYRQHGIWTKGADLAGLPRAAVVVGSSGDSAVKFSSTVTLKNITYANATYAKVVVGAYFGADAGECKVVVNAVDGNFVEDKDTDGYILCDNYTDGIVTINGTVQKHPANA